jgi:hypothetical protein
MGELSFSPYFDEAGIGQFLNMMGKGGRRNRHGAADIAAGQLASPGDPG